MAIVKYSNRLVGFFDVLGFSRLLESRPIEDLHNEYSQLIDEANNRIFEQKSVPGSPEPHVSNFAKSQFLYDSVVLVSHETEDVKNTCKFILSCLLLVEKAIERGFFLRGCISFGDVLDDQDRDVFLSPQFPTLVELEKDQDWLGCCIEDSAEAIVLNGLYGGDPSRTREQTRSVPLVRFGVPFKNGRKAKWCINWVVMLDRPTLQSKLPLLVSPKRENTERFVEFLDSLSEDSQALPPDAKPAVGVRFMKTRGSCRIKFFDENGCGVNPGWKSWTFAAFENP